MMKWGNQPDRPLPAWAETDEALGQAIKQTLQDDAEFRAQCEAEVAAYLARAYDRRAVERQERRQFFTYLLAVLGLLFVAAVAIYSAALGITPW